MANSETKCKICQKSKHPASTDDLLTCACQKGKRAKEWEEVECINCDCHYTVSTLTKPYKLECKNCIVLGQANHKPRDVYLCPRCQGLLIDLKHKCGKCGELICLDCSSLVDHRGCPECFY